MLRLEGDEIDEHVGPRIERRAESALVAAIDRNVLDARRKLALAAAAEDNVPAPRLKPGNQCASGLAASAQKKCPPRHGRDDSSLIF